MTERAAKGPTSDIEPFIRDFDQFYLENYRSVVALVYTLTGSRYGAEDIPQDAFLRTHRLWREVSGYERPDGWVHVVAMNLARSRLRRIGAETRALSSCGRAHTNGLSGARTAQRALLASSARSTSPPT